VKGHAVGVDLGTTGARAVRIDEAGRVVSSSTAAYPLLTPQPGWTEQEPAAWWDAAVQTLRTVVAAHAAPIEAVGVTGQMHGAVFLDTNGDSIRPALLWNDQRTVAAAQQIEAAVGRSQLQRIAGNPALTGFQAPKIVWLREHEPHHYARVRAVLLPKDFLRYRLSRTYGTDASDASGTLLFDLRLRDWSDQILRDLDLQRDWFPPVAESPAVTARVSDEAARATGLRAGTPVVAGAGDNAAAAIGSGIVRRGEGLVSLGTSGVILVHDDEPHIDPSGAIHAFCAAVPGGYHSMGVMLSAGGSLRWLRDLLGHAGESYGDLTAGAQRVVPGSDGLTFLPYLAGERTPHMNPRARGAFVGLTLVHGRDHFVRAVLEGVAYGLNDALVRIRELGMNPPELIATGNGMASSLWREIIAAILGLPLRRLRVDEGPAFGAALLGAVGTGTFVSVEAAARATADLDRESERPAPASIAAYGEGYQRFRRLYPALHDTAEPLLSLS